MADKFENVQADGNIDIEVEDMLRERNDILLVDMRDAVSYQHGHIESAFSVPEHICSEVEWLLRRQHKEKTVVYCSVGENSREIVRKLREQGVDAWNLKGGFHAWLVKEADKLSANEIERYSRQIVLPEIGKTGQEKLKNAKVLVVGAGGLGSPALLYLAAAGVGTIGIADGDQVDLTNLQRQIIHKTSAIGEGKAASAQKQIHELNPDTQVRLYEEFLTPDNIEDIIAGYDFVIDGVDNFESKFLINDACVIHKIPFCHAGILKFQGQVMTWLPGRGPCYRCIFEDVPGTGIPNCSQAGIIGAVAGIIGSIQALEAIKYITGVGELLTGRMFILDGLSMETRIAPFQKKSERCRVCGSNPQIMDIKSHKDLYQRRACTLL